MKNKIILLCIIVLIIGGISAVSLSLYKESKKACAQDDLNDNEKTNISKIDKLIQEVMNKSRTPGMAVTIVDGEKSYYLNYGFSNIEKKEKVNEKTLFEIGSMSKAFTGLAILKLEEENLLSLDDDIKKYIPWLKFYYKGEYLKNSVSGEVTLKVSDFLYHTSGIPTNTIGYIPTSNSDDALLNTIKNLNNMDLDFYPGEKYQYVSLNYDVLGLVIQQITKMSYEDYIKTEILSKLGLNLSFADKSKIKEDLVLATGYKTNFFKTSVYESPCYRGNTPAAYIVSCSKDMERWIRIQMGEYDTEFSKLIDQSHKGNTRVASRDEYYYGAGWNSFVKGAEKQIYHGGANPNFSSVIAIRPEKRLGVSILTNKNTSASEYLGENILDIIEGKTNTHFETYKSDKYSKLDTFFSLLTILSSLFLIAIVTMMLIAIIEIKKKKRMRIKLTSGKVAGVLLAMPLIAFMGFCVYYLPNVVLERMPWEAVNVWGSDMIRIGSVIGFFALTIFLIYVLVTFNYVKEGTYDYFSLIILSILNGLASALIIFTINESFNRELKYSKELLVYFIFSILYFVYTIKLLQGRLIVIANELAYSKRMGLIDVIFKSNFERIERIGSERLMSGLNNDCSVVSQIPEILVSFFSNSLTLLFCLGYLFSKSRYAFTASLGIIVLNGLLSLVTSRKAQGYLEKNRDVQDTFIGQIYDLINGFKELALNVRRKKEFNCEIKHYARLSTEFNKSAAMKFLNFSLYNTLMYNLVFGVVVFLFPIFVYNIQVNDLRENLFIVFYMIGPFGTLINTIPRITNIKVNFDRINRLIGDLRSGSLSQLSVNKSETQLSGTLNIEYIDICYKYINNENYSFELGPLNFTISQGEIIFVTGGNGSGKSTLAKVITGLYAGSKGKININGKAVDSYELNELFSAVYCDFNLFDKLYGIDFLHKKEKIKELLRTFELEDKISIDEEGRFSTLELSSGQKKRLALIVACLEDKPFMILDEWAAEQDPRFKNIFYEKLLPCLKQENKAIVVVTHDDRYFHLADKRIVLENGKLVKTQSKVEN